MFISCVNIYKVAVNSASNLAAVWISAFLLYKPWHSIKYLVNGSQYHFLLSQVIFTQLPSMRDSLTTQAVLM